MRNDRLALPFLTLLLAAGTLGCASGAIPGWQGAERAAERGRALVERSVEAYGGDLFAELEDLSVSYEGRWGRIAPLLQPILVDKPYRRASEERYLLGPDPTVAQLHTGPGGSKSVLRTGEGVAVSYDGREIEGEDREDEDRLAASALVADVYLMLITAPSWFLRPEVEVQALGSVVEEGRAYERVQARFRPGFGFSEEDHAMLWIDRESQLLHRVQFSINGFRRTVGAEVDVVFSEHREIAGRMWPTLFVERIRRPVSAFAHRWRLVGLDIDRGLEREDLELGAMSPEALAPAGSPAGAGEGATGERGTATP